MNLTHEQIEAMEAGYGMDALILENIFNFPVEREADGTPSTFEGRIYHISGDRLRYKYFHPSTDIADAWEVVEKIKYGKKGDCFTIQRGRFSQDGLWEVGYYYDDYTNCFSYPSAKAETVPLAICRFALMIAQGESK
jgi:hypothetical protein